MNDRERLIELIIQAETKCAKTSDCCKCEQYGKGEECTAHNLADHLLANGVIVQKQGKWEIKRDDCDFEYMMCSCCKEEFFPEGCAVETTPKFCPNCGAKMKKREEK